MSDLAPSLVNDTLMGEALNQLSKENEVYLIHDPSDIRKPHSEQIDNLGKVRDLKGNIINGFSTHNVVAITPKNKTVRLLSHESYSNKDDNFLKAETIKALKADKDFDDKEKSKKLYDSGRWFNKKSIAKSAINRVSTQLKENTPDIKVTHILDREFDDDDYCTQINGLGDNFIIRSKKSRSESDDKGPDGKKIKLIDCEFTHKEIILLKKYHHRKRCFQDATLEVEWRRYNAFFAVRVTIKDRQGKNIFENPMLLITNKRVETSDQAMLIYQIYLKRSRIESVFKFLKEGLGWEEMQSQDFQAIQNLLSACFFVAAYLYEIGEKEAYDDYTILLAEMGGGKGVVSRHFIMKGIQALMTKYRVDRIFEKQKPSDETIENLLALAGAN